MNLVFTEHVRSLAVGDSHRSGAVSQVWDKLRSALIAEMRQRMLLTAPPACLGIYGASAWSDGEALDELVADCYVAVFLRRLPGLTAQLESKTNVEGLVFRNIRHYLLEAQRKHDPLGFRVFTVLRRAVWEALENGALRLRSGDPEIRNETVLALGDGAGLASGAELKEPVADWTSELLPELVTARGGALDRVVSRFADHLSHLGELGIEAFRFKELADVLKNDVRARWNAVWSYGEGDKELAILTRRLRPDPGFEEREAFEKLVACVSEALARGAGPPGLRGYLERLWIFLRSHAGTSHDGQLPSRRKIAELLGIPRARFGELYTTLGRSVERCQESFAGSLALAVPEEVAR